MKLFWILASGLALVMLEKDTSAATKYCRTGASGSNNGSDWTNAYTTVQALENGLARGDTGYIAGGTYNESVVFNTVVSGTTLITLKRATVADHGTATGWLDSYSTQAIIATGAQGNANSITFSTDYWVLDGQVGGGPNSFMSGHGIRIFRSTSGAAVIYLNGSHITLAHCDVEGDGGDGGGSTSGGDYQTGLAFGNSGFNTIQYCKVHDCGASLVYGSPHDTTFEYSAWYHNESKPPSTLPGSDEHSSCMQIDGRNGACGNNVIRWNWFLHAEGTGGITYDSVTTGSSDTLIIYGNVLTENYNPVTLRVWDQGNGVIAGWTGGGGEQFKRVKVYNNTFEGMQQPFTSLPITYASNDARNNYLRSCATLDMSRFATHDYNHYNSSEGTQGEAHGTSSTTAPFVNLSGGDFSLTADTTAGDSSVPSQYRTDMFGNVGTTRGAIQFSAGGSAGSLSISASTQTVSEGVGTATVTVNRSGGSTGAVGCSYATANGTATSGSDYTSSSGTLSWADGDTAAKTFTVSITDDGNTESSEDFTATISAGTGGVTIGSPSVQTITITDNDSPTIAVSTTSLAFGDNETSVNADLSLTVTNVGAGTLSGTASTSSPFSVTAGSSYNLTAGQVVTVTVRYNSSTKGSHSGTLTLTGGGGATVSLTGLAADVLTSPITATNMTVISPLTVNAGNYISQSSDATGNLSAGGRAVCYFNATVAGNYWLTNTVNAATTSNDTYWINIDAEPTDPTSIADVATTTGFQDRQVNWRGTGAFDTPQFAPKLWTLTTGHHKIVIVGREASCQIRTLTINAPSSGGSSATPITVTGLRTTGGVIK